MHLARGHHPCRKTLTGWLLCNFHQVRVLVKGSGACTYDSERHSESGLLPPVRICIVLPHPHPSVTLSLPKDLGPASPSVILSLPKDLGLCPGTEIPRQARDDRLCPGLRSLPFGYAQGRLELGMTDSGRGLRSLTFGYAQGRLDLGMTKKRDGDGKRESRCNS